MATMEADARSAANKVPSGANANGPILENDGPAMVGVRPADKGAEAETTASSNAPAKVTDVRISGTS
jgi:hypothetical protein